MRVPRLMFAVVLALAIGPGPAVAQDEYQPEQNPGMFRLPDGRLIVGAGPSLRSPSGERIAFPNGSYALDHHPEVVAPRPGGGIVLTGYGDVIALDGSFAPDASFGVGGKARLPRDRYSLARVVAVTPVGRVLFAGSTTS